MSTSSNSSHDSEALQHMMGWTGADLDAIEMTDSNISLDTINFALRQVDNFVRESNTAIRDVKKMLNDSADEKMCDLMEEPYFDRGTLLGKGHSSLIYPGTYCGQKIAIKEFDVDPRNPRNALPELRREITVHQKLCKLPGVIGFYGARIFSIPRVMALERADDSLHDAIHNGTCPFPITLVMKINILYQVASTMSAIHGMNILHCDLKPLNVLLIYGLDRTIQAKLADFGLSRQLNESNEHLRDVPQGTLAYMAPEVLEGQYHCCSDIYSFGVMMNEILAIAEPYSDIANQSALPFKVIRGMRPDMFKYDGHLVEEEIDSIKELIESCWHMEASRRPNFHSIARKLRDIQMTIEKRVPQLAMDKSKKAPSKQRFNSKSRMDLETK